MTEHASRDGGSGKLDWEQLDEDRRTPLMLASFHDNIWLVKYLIEEVSKYTSRLVQYLIEEVSKYISRLVQYLIEEVSKYICRLVKDLIEEVSTSAGLSRTSSRR